MEAINQNVILEIIKESEKKETITSSGIILPKTEEDVNNKKFSYGKVFSISSEIENSKLVIGDSVIISKFVGVKLEDGDKELIALNYKDIIAKL